MCQQDLENANQKIERLEKQITLLQNENQVISFRFPINKYKSDLQKDGVKIGCTAKYIQ